MRFSQITGILSFLLLVVASCSEPLPPRRDPFFDKLEKGDVTSEELDSLLEANGMAQSYLVKVPKDRFELTFPVSKKHVKKEMDIQLIDGEEVKIYEYKANMQYEDHDNLAYQLTYIHVGDLKTDKEIKKLFDEQTEYWLSAANAKLEYEKIIDLKGVPGRDLYLTIDESKLKTRNRMYYDRGIFYRLVVVTPEGNLFNNSIKEFLDSFKILD